MKLKHVTEGQRFILTRTGQEYKHHGMHPERNTHVLVAPFSNVPMENKMLHIMCEVEVIDCGEGRHEGFDRL